MSDIQKQAENHKALRKRLLAWHYNRSKTIKIVELLQSNYQCFRYKVKNRIGRDIDFREAIKIATMDELEKLSEIIDEERIGI